MAIEVVLTAEPDTAMIRVERVLVFLVLTCKVG